MVHRTLCWSMLALLSLGLPDPGRQDEAAPLAAGTEAPPIRLNDHEGRAVKVFPPPEGAWTILAFYPKAATPG